MMRFSRICSECYVCLPVVCKGNITRRYHFYPAIFFSLYFDAIFVRYHSSGKFPFDACGHIRFIESLIQFSGQVLRKPNDRGIMTLSGAQCFVNWRNNLNFTFPEPKYQRRRFVIAATFFLTWFLKRKQIEEGCRLPAMCSWP